MSEIASECPIERGGRHGRFNFKRLNSVAVDAVEVLTAIMNDPTISPYARQQSARTILEFAYKAYENEAIIEKLEELETVISIDNKDI